MIMFGKMKAGSLAAVASATFLAASGMLCSMNAAYAQYVGPSQVRQYNNVAEILKNPVDDTYVTLKGNITTQLTDKMYRFTDGTGSINAKIGPKEFTGQRIDDKTRVEIWGEVHNDPLRKDLHLDVKRLSVLR